MPQPYEFTLPSNYDFPVNLQIRIVPDTDGYRFYIKDDWSDWYDFNIQLKQKDAGYLNTMLQNVIQKTFGNSSRNTLTLTDYHNALLVLAEKGRFAFNHIFSDGQPRETIRAALKNCKTIQVTSTDFSIPWELLYDGPLDEGIDAHFFWGMRYIISRNFIRAGNKDAFTSPVIPSCPLVGLILNEELENVAVNEYPYLKKLEEEKKIQVSLLRSLNSSDLHQRNKELADFGRFLSDNLHIIHLACHATEQKIVRELSNSFSERILNEAILTVSSEFEINMSDFDTWDFKLRNKPLAILNACLTGTIDPQSTSNWAVLFWKCGARGVLATEFYVPDWFAASFIKELYILLLEGKTIGEALLATRHHFKENQNTLLGLAYALYSRLDIRIAPSSIY